MTRTIVFTNFGLFLAFVFVSFFLFYPFLIFAQNMEVITVTATQDDVRAAQAAELASGTDPSAGDSVNQAVAGCSAVGGFVSQGLQSIVTGNFDQFAVGAVTNTATRYANTVVNDLTGRITNSFSSFFNLPGASTVTSTIGLGGFGGGGTIPVNTVSINDYIQKIDVNTQAVRNKTTCTDLLAYVASKAALSAQLDSVFGWINSAGINGEPLYLSSVTDYLKDFKDEQFNIFVNETRNYAFDSPVAEEVIPNIIRTRARSEDTFENRSRYTLDEVTGSRLESEKLVSGDPSACRGYYWDCWNALIQPQNNPLGYHRLAMEEISRREEKASTDASARVSEGVQPVLECLEENADGLCLRWNTITPATSVKEQLNVAVTSPVRQLEAADQTAETLLPIFRTMISNFLNIGLQKIFQSINGSGGTNSIIDGPVTSSATLAINTSISLASAKGYVATRKDSVNDLNAIIPSLDQVSACYQALATQNPTESSYILQSSIQNDISKKADYENLRTSYTEEVALLEPSIARLEEIETSTERNLSQSAIITLSTEYQTIASELPGSAAQASATEQRNFLEQKRATISGALASCQAQLGANSTVTP